MFHTNVISFLAIGGLVCLVFVPNISAAAIQQVKIKHNAQNRSLLPMESLQIKYTEKKPNLLHMSTEVIKDKDQNPSLLPMESLQIAKIDKNMRFSQVDKKLNVLPMESLQIAKMPSENREIFKSPNATDDNENNNMKKSRNRLFPQGYKFNSQISRTVDNWPSNSYWKISEAQIFSKFDRGKFPKINIDYYRPLSAYEAPSNLGPKLIKNLKKAFDSPEFDKDKDSNNQHEITVPMSDDPNARHAKIDGEFKIQGRAYYPDRSNLPTVCMAKSTVYNKPRVVKWLRRSMYRHYSVDDGSGAIHIDYYQEMHRPIWFDLRYQLFKDGRSEECHIEQFKTWRQYSECALRRNQRMEYMIPKYPLHQMGYVFRWTTQMNEQPYNNYRSYIPRTDNWCQEHSCFPWVGR